MSGQNHIRKNSGISGCTSETDFTNPGVTRTESRTALSKLFRLTKPFAKRKGRTAKTVRPSRPIASVSRYHLYEKEAKGCPFVIGDPFRRTEPRLYIFGSRNQRISRNIRAKTAALRRRVQVVVWRTKCAKPFDLPYGYSATIDVRLRERKSAKV